MPQPVLRGACGRDRSRARSPRRAWSAPLGAAISGAPRGLVTEGSTSERPVSPVGPAATRPPPLARPTIGDPPLVGLGRSQKPCTMHCTTVLLYHVYRAISNGTFGNGLRLSDPWCARGMGSAFGLSRGRFCARAEHPDAPPAEGHGLSDDQLLRNQADPGVGKLGA